jgi:hypothetical protein
MATQMEDPVARQAIADHVRHCDQERISTSAALQRIEAGQQTIWKAISRGRETRFRMVLAIVGFLVLVLVGLLGYIWQSSPAGATECIDHLHYEDVMKEQFDQHFIWEGVATNGAVTRIYQGYGAAGSWTQTVEQPPLCERFFGGGSAGKKIGTIQAEAGS